MSKNIINKIKTLRTKTGVSQEDISKYLGISRITYLNIEAGKRELKENELKKIADFFEKPISFFIDKNNSLNIKNDKNYKIKQLILYISEQNKDRENFGKTVLNKLLYFCDFNYYEWTDKLITGNVYKKLPYGPVPSNITEILDEMQKDGLIAMTETTYHGYTQQKIIPLASSNLDFLDNLDKKSKKETQLSDLPSPKKIIDDVLDKYKHHSANELSEWSHYDTPYLTTKNIGDEIKPGLVHYRSEGFIVNHHSL